MKQVQGFTRDGDIKLGNGWVIPKDFGHLTHGYCLTSYSAQSKGVDCVFIAESSESFRAADREQFYVSASRFKEALTIYTDDKRQLLAAVSKSSERPSATDLAGKHLHETSGRPETEKRGGLPIPEAGIEDVPREKRDEKPKTVHVYRRHLIHRRITHSRSNRIRT